MAVSLNPKLIPIFPQVSESVFNIAIFVWATLKNQGVVVLVYNGPCHFGSRADVHLDLVFMSVFIIYCSHYVFLLAKSLHSILEVSVAYRLVNYLQEDYCPICSLGVQCMISKSNGQYQTVFCAYFAQTNA